MKIPITPPPLDTLFARATESPERLKQVFGSTVGPTHEGNYLHWDKLRYREPPPNLSHEEWWLATKMSRRRLFQQIPLTDTFDRPFQYLIADPIPERLHQIDLGAGGHIRVPDPITNPETRDQYYISSLIEEAITSSQLEGATTTRLVAKEMIRSNRPPRDRSEQMILNNFVTMRRIGDFKDAPLTKAMVFEIHRLVTENTLDDDHAAGRFRRSDERVVIRDEEGHVFHTPPRSEELDARMEAMCAFANEGQPARFIHPVIRSIILHFWLAYDHPFVDGNGRTARALFYWSMLRHGYWLFEFISISRIILKAPAKYGRAFLFTETDENDLTYFILYHLDVIHRAIDELHQYIRRKAEELQSLEVELRGMTVLNHRQRALISHALRHPNQRYTIESHRLSHNVVYQTARTDLLDLQEKGLLECRKSGKKYDFFPAIDLAERLKELR